MITWNIYINDILVDEPQGWNDVIIRISRHDEWHGIFFEASQTSLTFYGTGADMLKTEKQENGLSATATFRAESVCGETVDVLEGNFDFGTYEESCGDSCLVKISIEKSGCTMVLNNRYDQKVDLSKSTAFDNTTLLPTYPGLSSIIELEAQQIYIVNEANMDDTAITAIITDDPFFVDCTGFNEYVGYITVPLPDIVNESFGVFTTASTIDVAECGESSGSRPPYPDFPTTVATADLAAEIDCALEDVVVTYRVKGECNATMSGPNNPTVAAFVNLYKLPSGADSITGWVLLDSTALISLLATGTDTFDVSNTISVTMAPGDFIHWGVGFGSHAVSQVSYCDVTFDPECTFKIVASATCESTMAKTSLINEAGARIVEAITDSCMTFKSDYYGRTDSLPYSSTVDGCGSLRVISNGLRIRNADPDKHFISLQDFFNGLRGIDNIGIGIESNTINNTGEWVRFEPVEYFYQDVSILSLPSIPNALNKLQASMAYSKISVGYQQWEVEKFNGLNEFNSNKEFRTSTITINNTLDAVSPFVAGGIPIEVTRQQTFAISGAADTKYDDETFIICTDRNGYYSVEFSAAGNSMTFETPGNGFEFLIATITIVGSVSNNGLRTILSTSLSSLSGNRTTVLIVFNGGATIDETATGVTFTGIISNGMFVEKNNITSPVNIYSPTTAYNWRIRPLYNLMRWFKSIASIYINLSSTTSKIFFNSGTGNYQAEGQLTTPDSCALENKVLAENTDLTKNDFISTDNVPLFKPEIVDFTYPLSISDYLLIKANPYGYLNIQCGNGDYEKAFIKSIDYKPAQGEAAFTLIKKWQ